MFSSMIKPKAKNIPRHPNDNQGVQYDVLSKATQANILDKWLCKEMMKASYFDGRFTLPISHNSDKHKFKQK